MKRWANSPLFSVVLLIALLQGCATSTPKPAPTLTPTITPTATPVPLPPLHGLAYSPYRDCQSPDTPNQPTIEDIRQDLQIISGMANGIRTYSSTGINAEIPALASQMGLRVSAGAELGRDRAANELEIQGLIDIADHVKLESVIVGNEVLLRGDLTEDELLQYIERVKNAVNVPVTTAEIGGVLLSHSRVMAAVDYEMVHLYPFWEGKPVENAAQLVVNEYHDIQNRANGKRVVIGETGWPSAGPAIGAAVPGPENQRRFAQEFLTLARAENVEFYYFSAFDEMWKTEGGVGSYWGLLYADRTFKSDVQNLMVSYNVTPQPLTDGGEGSQSTPQVTPQGNEPGSGDFYVYSNFGNPQNHYAPGGWMGDLPTIGLNTCSTDGQKWPESAIQVTYTPGQDDQNGWTGIYWLQPDGNWGTIPNAGFDLTNYKQLVFQARAEIPGTQIKFFVGGVSKDTDGNPLPYPSSVSAPIFAQEADPADGFVNLTDSWQEYHIDLTNADLGKVIDGFGLAAERARTPDGAIFYMDNIRFVAAEPALGIVPPIHIYTGKSLRSGLDMGVDSSEHFNNWVKDLNGQMKANFPAGQSWGVVFITVGDPAQLGFRSAIDLSQYRTLSVEMRGELGGETVYIGIKDKYQPDNGSEIKLPVRLSADWRSYTFDLQEFRRVDLSAVYIPIEFVFENFVSAKTIYFRNIQYLP
jgi:exo-beta-1,3-glucanase (GH17 family)